MFIRIYLRDRGNR